MKVVFNCAECGKEYLRYYKNNGDRIPKNPCCSKTCKGVWQSKNLVGENNPNYNNRWDEKQRQNLREKTSASMTPERRAKIGDQHRGKKMSPESIAKIHANRTPESYSRPHTKEDKRKIGVKSSEKFKVAGYLEKVRRVMEERGHWIPLKDKDEFRLYSDAADWISNMFEDLSLEECDRINKIGMFNTKTNQRGMCRDHMYSRKEGFDNLVFPEILRHPCNCEFIRHSNNSSKRSKSSKNMETLFSEIKNYTGSWHEHQRVLDLIESYEDGFRWDIKQFIEGFYNV